MSPENRTQFLEPAAYTDFSRELRRIGDEGPHVIFRALDRDNGATWPWFFRLPTRPIEVLTPLHLLMRQSRAGKITCEITVGPTILDCEWRAVRFFDDRLALVGGALLSQSSQGREEHLYQFVTQDYLVQLLALTHATLGIYKTGVLGADFTPIHPNDFLNPPG